MVLKSAQILNLPGRKCKPESVEPKI